MLENLSPSTGSSRGIKRIGRGQGSGHGKTAGRGNKGQRARAGSKRKVGFEGGQQPLYRRLPKVGFNSGVEKPYAISADRFPAVREIAEITLEALKAAGLAPKNAKRAKIIGTGASDLAAQIKDELVTTSSKK
ncbi:MAG: 50S ribosomal protein L15 [Helicobacteraceae bacterium]|jgi:large subunit ribosomal protein L15|nr:50S ribosomal protein L15 [Helicobacteraceae bacterium]